MSAERQSGEEDRDDEGEQYLVGAQSAGADSRLTGARRYAQSRATAAALHEEIDQIAASRFSDSANDSIRLICVRLVL